MSDPVYKIVEIVGTSDKGISDAIGAAVKKASKSLRHIGWFEAGQVRGAVSDGKAGAYQVTLKAGFTLEGAGGAPPLSP